MLDELLTLAMAMIPEHERQAFFNHTAKLTGKVPVFQMEDVGGSLMLTGNKTRPVEDADYDEAGNIDMDRLFT